MVLDAEHDEGVQASDNESISSEITRDDPGKPWLFRHPKLPESEPYVLVYRGVGESPGSISNDRIGFWWTVNPYYSIPKSRGKGTFFVAMVNASELDKLTRDVSIDEYPNYGFQSDPPGARLATDREFELLYQRTTVGRVSKLPGGTMIKTPQNFAQIGQEIFLPSFLAASTVQK